MSSWYGSHLNVYFDTAVHGISYKRTLMMLNTHLPNQTTSWAAIDNDIRVSRWHGMMSN
jgi:hypothetical protein